MKCDCSFQQQLVLAARFLPDLWNRSAAWGSKAWKIFRKLLELETRRSLIHPPPFQNHAPSQKICLRNASEDNKWLKGFKAFQAFSALSVSVISIAGDGIQRIPTCQGWTFFDTTQGYWKRDRNQLHFETYKSTLSIQNIHVILQSRSSPDKCLWNGIRVLRSGSDILTFHNRWNLMIFKK